MGIINERVSAGSNYRPFLFTPRYAVSISKKHKKNHLFFFYTEPQVNLVLISHSKLAGRTVENDIMNSNRTEWEAGLNAGFDYHCYFRSWYLFLGFGSGPHYISASIAKQADGFIFSDNFYAGSGKLFHNGISATVKVNFRHLSNAGLKEPNYGIDNILLFVGIAKDLR